MEQLRFLQLGRWKFLFLASRHFDAKEFLQCLKGDLFFWITQLLNSQRVLSMFLAHLLTSKEKCKTHQLVYNKTCSMMKHYVLKREQPELRRRQRVPGEAVILFHFLFSPWLHSLLFSLNVVFFYCDWWGHFLAKPTISQKAENKSLGVYRSCRTIRNFLRKIEIRHWWFPFFANPIWVLLVDELSLSIRNSLPRN